MECTPAVEQRPIFRDIPVTNCFHGYKYIYEGSKVWQKAFGNIFRRPSICMTLLADRQVMGG
jgi:hypothetical protein